MIVDFHTHPIAHGSGSYELSHLESFLEQARKSGVSVLGFSDHDRYLDRIDFSLKSELNSRFPDLEVRYGLEVDYFPDKEQEISEMISRYEFDYVIGSVHYIGDWPFDVSDRMARYDEWDIDELYSTYFKLLIQSARSGLFQIIGHMDLIKIFGFRPSKEVLHYAEPTLQVIKQCDLTVEINSAGLYKPIKEMYPEQKIIEKCFELNIPVTISSDAHQAAHVGRHGEEIKSLLKKIGYKQVASFKAKKRQMLPL